VSFICLSGDSTNEVVCSINNHIWNNMMLKYTVGLILYATVRSALAWY
jgi:hypothetical protein